MPHTRRRAPPLAVVERRWDRYVQAHPWVEDALVRCAVELGLRLEARPRLVRRLRVLGRRGAVKR